ncbi:hypothetical protein K443DRAFT_680688 [Laccaria amethystina LaAM-08-1]|uniref:Unplaced genomic scaffold K443scaffold_131, whole genome shotgun sequence n=1 Tax=Laccaria amethystina LaAM-08-1 TaxID=1095629 RepID=A0A0C9X0C2_9AGAR|nr:hypothetical protein K443DRAFT_680688 [Laccaria amethystina LaAM-08-1]
MSHIRTFQDESVIITPNDFVSSPDGKSFSFTNDHSARVGLNLHGKIGIVQAPNGTLYVANTGLTMQAGKSLVITDYVKTGMKRIKISLILLQDRGMDNLLVDLAGHVWAAALPTHSLSPSNTFQSPVHPTRFVSHKHRPKHVLQLKT